MRCRHLLQRSWIVHWRPSRAAHDTITTFSVAKVMCDFCSAPGVAKVGATRHDVTHSDTCSIRCRGADSSLWLPRTSRPPTALLTPLLKTTKTREHPTHNAHRHRRTPHRTQTRVHKDKAINATSHKHTMFDLNKNQWISLTSSTTCKWLSKKLESTQNARSKRNESGIGGQSSGQM